VHIDLEERILSLVLSQTLCSSCFLCLTLSRFNREEEKRKRKEEQRRNKRKEKGTRKEK
jgi:hypothetical protein